MFSKIKKKQTEDIDEMFFTSKYAEIYSKYIELLADKWQQNITNNGEFQIE